MFEQGVPAEIPNKKILVQANISLPTREKNMRSVSLHVGILLGFVCCVHLQEKCSSLFSFSFLTTQCKDSDSIADFKVDSELACALRCSKNGDCSEATFCRESKKCSLYQRNSEVFTHAQSDSDKTGPRIVSMIKVSYNFLVCNHLTFEKKGFTEASMSLLRYIHN